MKKQNLMKYHLLLVWVILWSSYTIGQTNAVLSEEQANIISEKTNDFPENTELAIALIKNGQVSYHGVKRVNDSLEYSSNNNHLFEIGSITKVFTSTLLANLILEDKIQLDTPIQSYLNYPIQNKQITVLQLANHTSGLPRLPSNLDLGTADPTNPYKDYSKDDLKKYLTSEFKLNNQPGSTYEYSNVGAGILGYLLEQQTNLTYEELLQKYILSKYNMINTTTDINNAQLQIVAPLDYEGNETSHWDLNALVAAGGILSNVEDLSKFVIAHFNIQNKELELSRKTTFEIPQYHMEVGLAWNIIKPDTEHTWHMHNGGTGGYTSIVALDNDNKNGIIILSNVSAFNEHARNIDQICLGLMKTQY